MTQGQRHGQEDSVGVAPKLPSQPGDAVLWVLGIWGGEAQAPLEAAAPCLQRQVLPSGLDTRTAHTAVCPCLQVASCPLNNILRCPGLMPEKSAIKECVYTWFGTPCL